MLDAARISAAENRTVELLAAHWCKSISHSQAHDNYLPAV